MYKIKKNSKGKKSETDIWVLKAILKSVKRKNILVKEI